MTKVVNFLFNIVRNTLSNAFYKFHQGMLATQVSFIAISIIFLKLILLKFISLPISYIK